MGRMRTPIWCASFRLQTAANIKIFLLCILLHILTREWPPECKRERRFRIVCIAWKHSHSVMWWQMCWVLLVCILWQSNKGVLTLCVRLSDRICVSDVVDRNPTQTRSSISFVEFIKHVCCVCSRYIFIQSMGRPRSSLNVSILYNYIDLLYCCVASHRTTFLDFTFNNMCDVSAKEFKM